MQPDTTCHNDNPTLSILLARFDNRPIINASEIYQVITPIPKNPKRTAIESISRGDFPLPTQKINGRRYVRLVDLANLIDRVDTQDKKQESPATKRIPGRPRKLENGGAI